MNFNEYLETKDAVYGVFTKTNDPFFIEILGRAGFDFVILDSEHGPNDPRALYPLIMAASLNEMYPIVRVPKLTDIDIQRVMDLGVAGVQIPQIQCKEDALQVRQFTRFYPKGLRGVCRFVRPADFSLKDKKYKTYHFNLEKLSRNFKPFFVVLYCCKRLCGFCGFVIVRYFCSNNGFK